MTDPRRPLREELRDVRPPALLLVSGAIGLLVWYSGLTGTWDAAHAPAVIDPRHVLLAVTAGFLACTPLLGGLLPVTTAALALVATASLVVTGQASDTILAAPLFALVLIALDTVPRRLARTKAPAPLIDPGDIRRGSVPLPRLPLGTVAAELRRAGVLAAVSLALVGGGIAWTVHDAAQVRELRADGVVVTAEIVEITREGRRKISPTAYLDMPDGTRIRLERAVAWNGLELEVRWLPGTDRAEETSNPERPTRPLGLSGAGLAVLLGAGAFVRRAVVARRTRG